MQTVAVMWLGILAVGGVFVVFAAALGRVASDADAQIGRDAAELRALLAVSVPTEADADPTGGRDPAA